MMKRNWLSPFPGAGCSAFVSSAVMGGIKILHLDVVNNDSLPQFGALIESKEGFVTNLQANSRPPKSVINARSLVGIHPMWVFSSL